MGWLVNANALEYAAWRGDVDFLQQVHNLYYGVGFPQKMFHFAALGGQCSVMHWLQANGYPCTKMTCAYAACGGQWSALQWLREQDCPWDQDTWVYAIKQGHLDFLPWLKAKRCPWDATVCSAAAESGQLSVLQWLRDNGCPWDDETCTSAAINNRLEILQWASAQGCPMNDKNILELALWKSHWPVCQWLLDQRPSLQRKISFKHTVILDSYYTAARALATQHGVQWSAQDQAWLDAITDLSEHVLDRVLCRDVTTLVQAYC